MFVEQVLEIAAKEMADGSDYWPHCYFLLPDENLDVFAIDPNFMATPRSKDALRVMVLKHLRDRGGVYAVLVSDAWGAVFEVPKDSTPEQERERLPNDLSTYAEKTELLLASVFGEGIQPILVQWPYSRQGEERVFQKERIRFSEAKDKLSGRFAPDLSGGAKPA